MTFAAAAGLAVALLLMNSDADIIAWMRLRDGTTVTVLRTITDIALVQWFLVPAALVVVALARMDWRSRPLSRRGRMALLFGQALYVFGAVALAQIIVRVFKFLIGRGRPELLDAQGSRHFEPFALQDLYWSFPSGHSATAGALAMILALWFARLRWLAVAVGLVLGASRVASDAHYPSDVVAGLTVGALTALFIARWLASRGVVFRFSGSDLLPVPRFARRGRPGNQP